MPLKVWWKFEWQQDLFVAHVSGGVGPLVLAIDESKSLSQMASSDEPSSKFAEL
jgi:hypothetical protein